MSFFHQSSNVDASGSTFTAIAGHQINNNINREPAVPDLKALLEISVPNAAYNRDGQVSRCLPGTREGVLAEILKWVDGGYDRPLCWLSGPAGSGKSAIVQTVAERCAEKKRLAASFFFFRGEGNRSNTTRFFTTLAYQLAISMPDTKASILRALHDDPSIPSQAPSDQFQKLFVNPVLAITAPIATSPMVVIIDGLDECEDRDRIVELIEIISRGFGDRTLPFRFLFASRGEEYIRCAFDSPGTSSQTRALPLLEFAAHEDICLFFRVQFAAIYERRRRVMQHVSLPWPSESDLRRLVQNSSDLFIFASTLVKFVDSGDDLPHHILQTTLNSHSGLDPLYSQVFSVVAQVPGLLQLVGKIVLLRQSLSILGLGQLLQLASAEIVHPLLHLQSILMIPVDDSHPIQLFHASLRDFLTSQQRAGQFFVHPPRLHSSIVINCVDLITKTLEEGMFGDTGTLHYACLNWYHHLEAAVVEGEGDKELNCNQLYACLKGFRFKTQSFTSWINTVISDLDEDMDKILAVLKLIVARLKGSCQDTKNLERVIKDIQECIKKDNKSFKKFYYDLYAAYDAAPYAAPPLYVRRLPRILDWRKWQSKPLWQRVFSTPE